MRNYFSQTKKNFSNFNNELTDYLKVRKQQQPEKARKSQFNINPFAVGGSVSSATAILSNPGSISLATGTGSKLYTNTDFNAPTTATSHQ